MRRIVIPIAAAAGPPLLVRALLLASEPGSAPAIGFPDPVLSDLAVSLIVAGVLAAASRFRGWAGCALALLWGLVHYAQYEHAYELDSNLQLATAHYIVDATFLKGSAIATSRPGLMAVLALGPLLLMAFAPRSGKPAPALAFLAAGATLLGGLMLTSVPPGRSGWRELHFAHEALFALADSARPVETAPREPLVEFRADLAGTPVPFLANETERARANVLLVVLEGLTGAYIEPIAEAHGVRAPFTLPRLSEVARHNVVATSFITHQRQTNRGMYALLCGDYPKLASKLARMTEYLNDDSRRCLPRVLGERGYASDFIQGAPLGFMFKGAFMERAGFDRVFGDRHFESPDIRTNWGVDDGTLFRRALALIDEREATRRRDGTPWFMTVLTVGTHHPYILPPDREPVAEAERAETAFRWLDDRVGAFLDALSERGVLEDTLVLVTVDESRGTRNAGGSVARLLHQSWGTFIALLPSKPHFVSDAAFAQSDVALSIVDYLGIDPATTPFIGRSLFREYDTPRRIFFSNTHKRQTGAIFGRDTLYVCPESMAHCVKFAASPKGLFGGEPTPAEFEAGEFTDPIAVVARSLASAGESRTEQRFQLSASESFPIWGIENQRILDGQNLFVPAASRIDVDIELRLIGEAGYVDLHHVLDDSSEHALAAPELPRLDAGDTLSIRYSVETPVAVRNLKCRLKVRDSSGEGLSLRVERAILQIAPVVPVPADVPDAAAAPFDPADRIGRTRSAGGAKSG